MLFWSAGLPKIKSKKLSFVMISLGLNVIATPLALFMGGMASASPTSTTNDFWAGFLFIQGIRIRHQSQKSTANHEGIGLKVCKFVRKSR
ncbi:hypothetical protein [Lysinibacillus sp. KCTC 33748]|uniref:hypothetical protein n=1 Tax=Lysinibacillus sp. KCTC 33748 TaxID=1955700 RepID=UPI003204F4D3